MSIATLNGGRGLIEGIRWPEAAWSATAFTLFSMSAAAHFRAFSFIAPKAGNIHKVHFRTGTVSTGDTLRVSFQNVDALGYPDNTDDQYRDLVVDSADDNAWLSTGIISSDGTDGGALRAVSVGERLAVVFKFPSYVAGSLWLQYMSSGSTHGHTFLAFSNDSGTTWALQAGTVVAAVEYDDGSMAFLENASPIKTITFQGVLSTSTPDEYCLKFRLPFPTRCLGMSVFGASQDIEMGLYPDSGAALATGTPLPSSATMGIRRTIMFSSAVDLAANTWYRLSWKPTTASSRSIPVHTLHSAAYREAFSPGLNFALGTRTDGGAWSDDDTKFIVATPLISGFEDGAGGGGGSCSYGSLPNGTRVVPVAQ